MGIRSRIKSHIKSLLGREERPGAAATLREAFARLPAEPDGEGYRAVATSDLLPEGAGNTFTLGSIGVAIFRVNGKLYAIDDACAHEDGPLGEGKLSGQVVTCPYHDWRYDVTTGDCLSHAERSVSCYAVKEKDGFIWVGRRTREGTKDRGGQHDDGLITPEIKL